MSIIEKPGLDIIHSLVKAENPWMPGPVTDRSVRLSDVTGRPDGRVNAILSGVYGSGYVGRKPITYRMLDLAKLFGGFPLEVGTLAVRPMHEQLTDIFHFTGIRLDPRDIVNIVPEAQDLPYVTTLRATPTSAAYVGEIEITFTERPSRLDEIVPRRDYDVSLTPFATNPDGRIRGEFLSYGIDYTSLANTLKLVVGPTVDETLLSAMTSVDDIPWVTMGLLEGTMYYNGPAPLFTTLEGYRYPNPRYTHVLVLDIPFGNSTFDLASQVYVHYNVME